MDGLTKPLFLGILRPAKRLNNNQMVGQTIISYDHFLNFPCAQFQCVFYTHFQYLICTFSVFSKPVFYAHFQFFLRPCSIIFSLIFQGSASVSMFVWDIDPGTHDEMGPEKSKTYTHTADRNDALSLWQKFDFSWTHAGGTVT